jgi:hypothetical protein
LEQRAKRVENVELELKRLGEVNKGLELSNATLRVSSPRPTIDVPRPLEPRYERERDDSGTNGQKQISNGVGSFHGTKATIDGLQEKAKSAEVSSFLPSLL